MDVWQICQRIRVSLRREVWLTHFSRGPSPPCCLHTGSGEFQEWDSPSSSSVSHFLPQCEEIPNRTNIVNNSGGTPQLEWKYWQVFRNKTIILVWYLRERETWKRAVLWQQLLPSSHRTGIQTGTCWPTHCFSFSLASSWWKSLRWGPNLASRVIIFTTSKCHVDYLPLSASDPVSCSILGHSMCYYYVGWFVTVIIGTSTAIWSEGTHTFVWQDMIFFSPPNVLFLYKNWNQS